MNSSNLKTCNFCVYLKLFLKAFKTIYLMHINIYLSLWCHDSVSMSGSDCHRHVAMMQDVTIVLSYNLRILSDHMLHCQFLCIDMYKFLLKFPKFICFSCYIFLSFYIFCHDVFCLFIRFFILCFVTHFVFYFFYITRFFTESWFFHLTSSSGTLFYS